MAHHPTKPLDLEKVIRFTYIVEYDAHTMRIGEVMQDICRAYAMPYQDGVLLFMDRRYLQPIHQLFAAAAEALELPDLFPSRYGSCKVCDTRPLFYLNCRAEEVTCPHCGSEVDASCSRNLSDFVIRTDDSYQLLKKKIHGLFDGL